MQVTSVDVDQDEVDVDREPTALELAAIELTMPVDVLLADYALLAEQVAAQESTRLLTAYANRAGRANALVSDRLVPPERWGWAR